jgi:hypothetical protein
MDEMQALGEVVPPLAPASLTRLARAGRPQPAAPIDRTAAAREVERLLGVGTARA